MLAGLRTVGALSLGGLSALHLVWATGSAWPAADRTVLADAVGGFSEFPGPGACVAVAVALGIGALCVAGKPRRAASAARVGSAVVALALGARGVIGLTGRMPNGKRSPRFAELDRRVYSPICIAIALTAVAGVARASS